MSTITQIVIKSCDRRVLELEQVKAWLIGNGLKVSNNHWDVDPKADIIILTTCGVTQMHEDFTFEMLDRIRAGKKPGAEIVLGGCVPEINPVRVAEEFEGPTFSPKSYEKLDDIFHLPRKLDEFTRPNTVHMFASYRTDVGNILGFARSLRGSLNVKSIFQRVHHAIDSRHHRQTTYFIQIHEGCSLGCSYCAIQKAIGPLRNSKPIETVLKEIHTGLDQGFRRIRLIGDSAGSYGLEIRTNLGVLLEHISRIERPFELELTDISPVFLKIIYEPVKTLCAQNRLSSLYIPIQSGNDRILRLMHRRYDIDKTSTMLNDIREVAFPGFKLGTSVIVGFPSETLEELKDTIQVCNQVNFDWVWCHGFSPRPGTSAATMPGQLPHEEVLLRVSQFKEGVHRPESVILDFQ